jgi:hypothetical protein
MNIGTIYFIDGDDDIFAGRRLAPYLGVCAREARCVRTYYVSVSMSVCTKTLTVTFSILRQNENLAFDQFK